MPLYAAYSMWDTEPRKESYRFEADEYGIIFDPPIPPGQWLMGHPMLMLIGSVLPRRGVLLSDVILANSKTVFVEIDEDGSPIPKDVQPPVDVVLGLPRKVAFRHSSGYLRNAQLHAEWGNSEEAFKSLEKAWWLTPEDRATARRALTAILDRRTTKQLERFLRLRALVQDNKLAEAQALLDRTLNLSDEDRALVQRLIKTRPYAVRKRPADWLRRRPRPPGAAMS